MFIIALVVGFKKNKTINDLIKELRLKQINYDQLPDLVKIAFPEPKDKIYYDSILIKKGYRIYYEVYEGPSGKYTIKIILMHERMEVYDLYLVFKEYVRSLKKICKIEDYGIYSIDARCAEINVIELVRVVIASIGIVGIRKVIKVITGLLKYLIEWLLSWFKFMSITLS